MMWVVTFALPCLACGSRVKSRALEEPPFQGLTWGDMLDTGDANPIGYDDWQRVVREFFIKKVG